MKRTLQIIMYLLTLVASIATILNTIFNIHFWRIKMDFIQKSLIVFFEISKVIFIFTLIGIGSYLLHKFIQWIRKIIVKIDTWLEKPVKKYELTISHSLPIQINQKRIYVTPEKDYYLYLSFYLNNYLAYQFVRLYFLIQNKTIEGQLRQSVCQFTGIELEKLNPHIKIEYKTVRFENLSLNTSSRRLYPDGRMITAVFKFEYPIESTTEFIIELQDVKEQKIELKI